MSLTFDQRLHYMLRVLGRQLALEEINSKILLHGGATSWTGTDLASFDDEALKFMYEQWTTPPKEDWKKLWGRAQLSPSRFDVAVWQLIDGKRVLLGAALGTRSSGNDNLTLNWFARNPGVEYGRFGCGISILRCFECYGELLEVRQFLIKNPADPTFWEKAGYKKTAIQGSKCSFWARRI